MAIEAVDQFGYVSIANVLMTNFIYFFQFGGNWSIYDSSSQGLNPYALPWATAYMQHMLMFFPMMCLWFVVSPKAGNSTSANYKKAFFWGAQVAQTGPRISYWFMWLYFTAATLVKGFGATTGMQWLMYSGLAFGSSYVQLQQLDDLKTWAGVTSVF